jgi:hypothetical protein
LIAEAVGKIRDRDGRFKRVKNGVDGLIVVVKESKRGGFIPEWFGGVPEVMRQCTDIGQSGDVEHDLVAALESGRFGQGIEDVLEHTFSSRSDSSTRTSKNRYQDFLHEMVMGTMGRFYHIEIALASPMCKKRILICSSCFPLHFG